MVFLQILGLLFLGLLRYKGRVYGFTVHVVKDNVNPVCFLGRCPSVKMDLVSLCVSAENCVISDRLPHATQGYEIYDCIEGDVACVDLRSSWPITDSELSVVKEATPCDDEMVDLIMDYQYYQVNRPVAQHKLFFRDLEERDDVPQKQSYVIEDSAIPPVPPRQELVEQPNTVPIRENPIEPGNPPGMDIN